MNKRFRTTALPITIVVAVSLSATQTASADLIAPTIPLSMVAYNPISGFPTFNGVPIVFSVPEDTPNIPVSIYFQDNNASSSAPIYLFYSYSLGQLGIQPSPPEYPDDTDTVQSTGLDPGSPGTCPLLPYPTNPFPPGLNYPDPFPAGGICHLNLLLQLDNEQDGPPYDSGISQFSIGAFVYQGTPGNDPTVESPETILTFDIVVYDVPEPSTLALLGIGASMLAYAGRRQKAKV